LALLGDASLPDMSYNRMPQEAAVFILACFSETGKTMLTDARIEVWKIKMWGGVPSNFATTTHHVLPRDVNASRTPSHACFSAFAREGTSAETKQFDWQKCHGRTKPQCLTVLSCIL